MSGRNGCSWSFVAAAIPFWGFPSVTGHRPTAANWQETSGGCRAQKSANAGHSWLMSDGTINILFAVRDVDAVARGEWTLTGVTPTDAEDISSATVGGQPYIYLADIGDNGAARTTVRIYRIKEPTINGSNGTVDAGDIETITCQYDATPLGEGGAIGRDAECLMVDPATGDMYILTKRISAPQCWKLAHASSYSGTQTLEYMGPLPTRTLEQNQTGSNGGYIVGGDISADGGLIVTLGYVTAHVHQRVSGMSIYESLAVAGNEITTLREPGIVSGAATWRTINPTLSFFNPQREALWFDSSSNLYVCSEYLTAGGHGASNYPIYRAEKLEVRLQTHSFQDGVAPTASYADTRDTYFYKSATGGNQTVVRGTEATIVTDYDSATDERNALVYWKLSDYIPANAVILAAELELTIANEGQELYLHKVIGFAWDETMSYATFPLGRLPRRDDIDAGATVIGGYGSANFNTFQTGTPAGDTGKVRIILTADGIAAVQDHVTTAANNKGFLLYAGTNTDGEQFHSREAVTTAYRPKLTAWWYAP